MTADKTTSDSVLESTGSQIGFKFGDDSQIANANPLSCKASPTQANTGMSP